MHDKDGGLGAFGFFQTLRDEGALSFRVWQSLPHERYEELEELGIRSGFGDDLLRIGYLKIFMDGTLGSQTARLLDGSGIEITSGAELAEIVIRSAHAGFPVAVHAIGDLANREALDAFEATQDVWRPLGLRHRIEHAQLLADEDLPRFAALGVAASIQLTPRTVRSGHRRSLLGRESRSRLPVPLPRRERRTRRKRLRRADRGARSPPGGQGRRSADPR